MEKMSSIMLAYIYNKNELLECYINEYLLLLLLFVNYLMFYVVILNVISIIGHSMLNIQLLFLCTNVFVLLIWTLMACT